jgi:hypothetical protein
LSECRKDSERVERKWGGKKGEGKRLVVRAVLVVEKEKMLCGIRGTVENDVCA